MRDGFLLFVGTACNKGGVFCKTAEDSLEHYCACPVVESCFIQMETALMLELPFGRETLFLEAGMGGRKRRCAAKAHVCEISTK